MWSSLEEWCCKSNTLLAHFHDLNIKHIYKEKNKDADTLSKVSLNTEESLILLEKCHKGIHVGNGSIYFFEYEDVQA